MKRRLAPRSSARAALFGAVAAVALAVTGLTGAAAADAPQNAGPVAPAESSATTADAHKDPVDPAVPAAKAEHVDRPWLAAPAHAATDAPALRAEPSHSPVRMTLFALLIAALVAAAIYKRRAGTRAPAGSSRAQEPRLRLVSSVKVGPKAYVSLCAIDDQMFLLGVTDQSVRRIGSVASHPAVIEAAASAEAGERAAPPIAGDEPAAPSFAGLLRGVLGKNDGRAAAPRPATLPKSPRASSPDLPALVAAAERIDQLTLSAAARTPGAQREESPRREDSRREEPRAEDPRREDLRREAASGAGMEEQVAGLAKRARRPRAVQ